MLGYAHLTLAYGDDVRQVHLNKIKRQHEMAEEIYETEDEIAD